LTATELGRRRPRFNASASRRLSAFGVSFALPPELDIPGLPRGPASGGGRSAEVRIVDAEELAWHWRGAAPRRTRELRHPDDSSILLTLDHDERLGFLLETPFHGRFAVSAGGAEVLCSPLAGAGGSWHGLFAGQVLPLTATVQGLEIFHAGAVALGGRASLFCAASGVGKSTLVLGLALRGGELVADDAAALEAGGGGVVVHPGTPLVQIRRDSERMLAMAAAAGVNEVPGAVAKASLALPLAGGPREVAALYFLERSAAGGPEVRIEALEPCDPFRLLGATRAAGVQTADRLRRHLELCTRLASEARIYRVRVPPTGAAEALADAVWAHMSAG
jgi:hypothetical protein